MTTDPRPALLSSRSQAQRRFVVVVVHVKERLFKSVHSAQALSVELVLRGSRRDLQSNNRVAKEKKK